MSSDQALSNPESIAWLRSVDDDFSFQQCRTKLLIAISDAKQMGFHATASSFMEVLRARETQRLSADGAVVEFFSG